MTVDWVTHYWFDLDEYVPVQCQYQYNLGQEAHAGTSSLTVVSL